MSITPDLIYTWYASTNDSANESWAYLVYLLNLSYLILLLGENGVRKRSSRNIKRNRRIYNQDNKVESPRKQPKPSPIKLLVPKTEKEIAQSNGLRLRNLLKLPKAHKWVCYEWFYSTLDQ